MEESLLQQLHIQHTQQHPVTIESTKKNISVGRTVTEAISTELG